MQNSSELFRAAEQASKTVFNTSVFSPEFSQRKAESFAAWDAYLQAKNAERTAEGLLPMTMIQF